MTRFHNDGSLPSGNEIFVFGSNESGVHGAGAALIASHRYGAAIGNGRGPKGNSYAIPTKGKNLETLTLDEIAENVKEFVEYTKLIKGNYFVTRVGCGLAGYNDEQIAPMFRGAKNCSFAVNWKPYL